MSKSKRKKKGAYKKRKHHKGLSGITASIKGIKIGESVKQGGLLLVTAIAAGAAGAALGKHSLLAALPVAITGAYMKNKYILTAALGLALSNGFQTQGQSSSTKSVDGFDMKQLAQDAKDRVSTYFENFKEKLYLTPATPSSATDGLQGGSGQAKYFVNPYDSKDDDVDFSAADRVDDHIANLNKNTTALYDIDREL